MSYPYYTFRLWRLERAGGAEAMPGPSILIVEEGGRGGVANYSAQLAGAIARCGWEVRVATARDHHFPPTPGVSVRGLFPYVRGRGPLGRVVRMLHLSRLVNGATHLWANLVLLPVARRCDVVHVQEGEWPPLTAVQALMLRATGRPVVHTAHNTFDRGARSYPKAHALIRRSAARIIVHSEYDRRILSPKLGPKVQVVAHGEYGALARRGPEVDPEVARRRLGIGHDELTVLLFGQLRPDKGIRDLLVAARELVGVRVVLAGADYGALGEAAGLLADVRLKDRVLVRAGYVPTAEADQLFAAADVVALPYQRASTSAVLLLAYGYRRPVLAYPVGGLPEYVEENQTGWLTASADPGALERTLRSVVASGRAECRRRGEEARRLSERRFGWDTIARQTIAVYGSTVAELPD